MKIDLKISQTSIENWSFLVSFVNDSTYDVDMPVDALKNNGARFGLRFQLGDTEMEPVEYTMIFPNSSPKFVLLKPNESLTIEFPACCQEKIEGVFALEFDKATYRILGSEKYRVSFLWQDSRSNIVEWAS